MKSIIVKSLEIFSDGTIAFGYSTLQSAKQVIFYEKDFRNLSFSKKLKKNQSFQNAFNVSYKSKFKL